MPCAAHKLQLSMKEGLRGKDAKQLIVNVHQTVRVYRKSPMGHHFLIAEQVSSGIVNLLKLCLDFPFP